MSKQTGKSLTLQEIRNCNPPRIIADTCKPIRGKKIK
jgi:hypothetical protein